LLYSTDINKLVAISRKMNRIATVIALFFSLLGAVDAFAPVTSKFGVSQVAPSSPQNLYQPAALQRQRQSMAQVQTMGLFGLGAPEIGVILVAAAFLLGPDKLAEFGKDAGKIAGELKEVPKEFQRGMDQGEAQAKATKSKIDAEDAEKSVDKSE
jgi:sec-independent protein translocase protein TatA